MARVQSLNQFLMVAAQQVLQHEPRHNDFELLGSDHRNRLLDGLLQMQVIGKALIGVAEFFCEDKAAVFKPLQHVAGPTIQFIEKHVVK